MPQSTDTLRSKWGIDPNHAVSHLHSNFTSLNGVIKPNPGYVPTDEDYSAIDFLMQEWDYAYEAPKSSIATFSYSMRSNSGYESSTEGTITPERHGEVMALLNGKPHPKAGEAAKLRWMLALRVAGIGLYCDDGEMQDNTTHPVIDFKRDSVDEIERKLMDRGLANFVQEMNGERP